MLASATVPSKMLFSALSPQEGLQHAQACRMSLATEVSWPWDSVDAPRNGHKWKLEVGWPLASLLQCCMLQLEARMEASSWLTFPTTASVARRSSPRAAGAAAFCSRLAFSQAEFPRLWR